MTRRVPLAGAALLLAACAHQPSAIDDGFSYSQRQARLSAVSDWDLKGQLIVDTGDRRERVRVAWEQRGDRLSLTVRGVVLGAGSFRIEGNAEQLVIEGRGETRVLDDPEFDLSREVGWWLPVTSLHSWLLGQADTAYPQQTDRGQSGTLASLRQREWQITYEEYQLADNLLVPRVITMTHGELKLRLTGIDWEPVTP
jgi:outer membrane lipoprotein LolB